MWYKFYDLYINNFISINGDFEEYKITNDKNVFLVDKNGIVVYAGDFDSRSFDWDIN